MVNHKFFKDNIRILSKTHRVVTLDLRGHGHSWSRPLTCNLPQAARDVRRVIEHLDLDDVTIAGWSMGAAVIFNYFDLFGGEKLKGAVYIDMTPCILKLDGWEHALFGSLDWRMAVKLQRDILADRLTFASRTVSACFKDGKCPDEATLERGVAESMLTSTEVTLEVLDFAVESGLANSAPRNACSRIAHLWSKERCLSYCSGRGASQNDSVQSPRHV